MADTPEVVGGPPAVDQTGNLTIWWVPSGGLADPTAPKASELAATGAKRITYSFLSDGWNVTQPQEKLDDVRLTSPQKGQSLGQTTPTLDDLKYVDSTAAGSAAVVLAQTAGATSKDGYFVERRNIPQSQVATATTDMVRVIDCTVGIQQPGPAQGTGKFSLVQSVAVHKIIGPVALAA